MQTYFGWSSFEEMQKDFADYGKPSPVPEDIEVLLASYEQGGYEGDAIVIYRKDGQLYEVHGSHCSCYGLEDKWSPELATVESLHATMPAELKYHDPQVLMAFGELMSRLRPAS